MSTVFPESSNRHHDAEALAFLNRLTQAVLVLSSPDEIISTVEHMLGDHLAVSRVLVAEASPDGETVIVSQTWEAEGMPKLQATTHRLDDYGERLLQDYRAGRVHLRRDAAREYPPGPELNAILEIRAPASIDVPVLVDGVFSMLFVVHQAAPRDWTEGEISLVQQVADRTAAEVRRAHALREAQTSERRRKAALEAAGVGSFNIDLATMRLDTDERFRAIFGVAADSLGYEEAFAVIHPDDRQMLREKVAAATNPENPQPYAVEHRVIHADGSIHWVAVRGGAAYEGTGENRRLATFDGTVIDITAQKHAVDELTFQRHQLELIFRESPAAMALWRGEELMFERVNPQYQAWFGERQLVGKALLEAVPELAGQGFDDMLRQVLHTGEPFTGAEVLAQFAREDGGPVEDRYFDFTYMQVCDPDGRPYGVYDHAVDVTSRVRARQALEESQKLLQHALLERQSLLEAERAARLEAEQASRMKDEFLATLSHELRTPLNAIVGWTQILHMIPDPPEDLVEGLEVISRNARAQTQIIEDILDMSRIISGKLRLNIQPVSLSGIVHAAAETLQPAANGKGVQLRVVAAAPTRNFSGDPNRLQQVFWNLISNAVKFTPKGGSVQISLQRCGDDVEVHVADTGEGISPEFLPHVFDRFRQADSTTTRVHGGLGLGLSIVKQIVELHGGTVRAESMGKGQGTSFVVSLPLGASPAGVEEVVSTVPHSSRSGIPEGKGEADDHPLHGIAVVVVDDEPDAAAFTQRLLAARGAAVRTASSAAQALTLIRTDPPDVLVSDIGMPFEDGYTLIRKVRALPPAEGGRVPAVALTAYVRGIDRVKALEAGFQMHVPKPVDPAELIISVATLAKTQLQQ